MTGPATPAGVSWLWIACPRTMPGEEIHFCQRDASLELTTCQTCAAQWNDATLTELLVVQVRAFLAENPGLAEADPAEQWREVRDLAGRLFPVLPAPLAADLAECWALSRQTPPLPISSVFDAIDAAADAEQARRERAA